LAQQQKLLHERAKLADFIISTAQVPGKPAPRLITKETVAEMRPGSVIVDLAAETGGNCELTKADQIVRQHGVTILGPTNLPATLPLDASRMFGRNLATFILEITNENGFTMDWKNEIFAQTCITHNGEEIAKRRSA
jgi:NAD(P) transhydrogenase subunit alpha